MRFYIIILTSLTLVTGCSEKQEQRLELKNETKESKPQLNYDFSIELIGEPTDTLGEIWNVKGIDIYLNNNNQPVQKISDLNTLTPVGRNFSGGFVVEDFNFDGIADFKLIKLDRKSGKIEYLFWFFDESRGLFNRCLLLDSVIAPVFDYNTKTVHSEYGSDSAFYYDTFKFEEDSLILLERKEKLIKSDHILINRYINKNGSLKLLEETRTN